jgi:hypothetical protein
MAEIEANIGRYLAEAGGSNPLTPTTFCCDSKISKPQPLGLCRFWTIRILSHGLRHNVTTGNMTLRAVQAAA